MILSEIKLNCCYHLDKPIVMIDQSSQVQGKNRPLCLQCIQNLTLKQRSLTPKNPQLDLQLITIEDFTLKVKQYRSQQEQSIKAKYDQEKRILKEILKLFTTLEEEAKKTIQSLENAQKNLTTVFTEELDNLKEFEKIMSYTKLEEIADILSNKNKQNLNWMGQEVWELIPIVTSSASDLFEKINKNLRLISETYRITKNETQNDIYTALPKNYDTTTIQEIENLQKIPKFDGDKEKCPPKLEKVERFQPLIAYSQPIQNYNQNEQINQSSQNYNYEDHTINQKNQTNKTNLSISVPIQQNEIVKNDTVTVESQNDCQWECQILVSNAKQSLIVGGARCIVMIWEQIQKKIGNSQILAAHVDLVSGVAVFNSRNAIVSGGKDGQLIVWEKNEKRNWAQIAQKNQEGKITNLKLTPDDKQIIVSGDNSTLKCFILHTSNILQLIQSINYSQIISSFSVNLKVEYMAVGGEEKLFQIYLNKQMSWSTSFKIVPEGVVQQLCFTEDHELVCQQSKPFIITIYYILEDEYEIAQTLKFQNNSASESFPIFKIDKTFCCKYGQKLYLIKKQNQGSYEVFKEISGTYEAACSDTTGTHIILKDRYKKFVQICSFY